MTFSYFTDIYTCLLFKVRTWISGDVWVFLEIVVGVAFNRVPKNSLKFLEKPATTMCPFYNSTNFFQKYSLNIRMYSARNLEMTIRFSL